AAHVDKLRSEVALSRSGRLLPPLVLAGAGVDGEHDLRLLGSRSERLVARVVVPAADDLRRDLHGAAAPFGVLDDARYGGLHIQDGEEGDREEAPTVVAAELEEPFVVGAEDGSLEPGIGLGVVETGGAGKEQLRF